MLLLSLRIIVKQDNILAENRLVTVSKCGISLTSASLRQLVFVSYHHDTVVVSRRAVDGDVLHVVDDLSVAEGSADERDSLEALGVVVRATVEGAKVCGGVCGGGVFAPREDTFESGDREVRGAAGDGGELEARVENTANITIGILASRSEAFDFTIVIVVVLVDVDELSAEVVEV